MPNVLLLGGTTEASALAQALAEAQIPATLSYMGRVERPKAQPIPVRIGGFGGVAGLRDYIRQHAVTHVVDATHPFAAQMSTNAVNACADSGTPLIALTRPAWQPGPGDDWQRVADIPAAVAALAGPARHVMLAIGRMHIHEFAPQPQHHYLLRLVDDPKETPPLPHHVVVVDRGPFSAEADAALMRDHKIDLVVSKNAGGTGSVSKLDAARALGLPVLMIDRPSLPPRHEVHEIADVLTWLSA
ncbi:cobalt-precorrin-6A reductase [Rhodobacter sp. NTK016B]|uniref:cobalt-precorrin-6A reductase n=1 Tax=Rhodobacter sp. NTK016B TaxID=2759676 RepID=UPI001A906439|nr:cobalt-precorrin-6A reductase [Rhodobacter sp. NTK016B]MBN8294776.1 cobalt-precorrin-6A reductase [Rhodobacter sp. NTK016B]